MAVEFAPHKVRVNAIAASATMTDRVRGRLEVRMVTGHVYPVDSGVTIS
jgi:NAD(P)-dependent dehydrogenase (short-subunit alcohol dehydrogenase family)